MSEAVLMSNDTDYSSWAFWGIVVVGILILVIIALFVAYVIEPENQVRTYLNSLPPAGTISAQIDRTEKAINQAVAKVNKTTQDIETMLPIVEKTGSDVEALIVRTTRLENKVNVFIDQTEAVICAGVERLNTLGFSPPIPLPSYCSTNVNTTTTPPTGTLNGQEVVASVPPGSTVSDPQGRVIGRTTRNEGLHVQSVNASVSTNGTTWDASVNRQSRTWNGVGYRRDLYNRSSTSGCRTGCSRR